MKFLVDSFAQIAQLQRSQHLIFCLCSKRFHGYRGFVLGLILCGCVSFRLELGLRLGVELEVGLGLVLGLGLGLGVG